LEPSLFFDDGLPAQIMPTGGHRAVGASYWGHNRSVYPIPQVKVLSTYMKFHSHCCGHASFKRHNQSDCHHLNFFGCSVRFAGVCQSHAAAPVRQ
jgi:ribulose 1,5-bisphosphate carboxylase large subunit-like protein